MNLNKKIRKFTADGIRGYNEAINELVDATNWLAGIRVINGKPITESDQGPVIDLSQVSSTQNQQPWAVDPDGNTAGWVLMTMINTQTGNFYDAWVWAGPSKNLRPVPWLTDPSGIIADWVVCADNTFWGTGGCPAGVGNFQQVGFTSTATGSNPYVLTGNVPSPPINIPSNPPAFYLEALSGENVLSGLPHQPCLSIGVSPMNVGDTANATFTWTVTYNGTTIFSFSGSGSCTYPNQIIGFCISSTDWIYDPGGLVGYSQGSKKWIYQYQGSISANTNPTFVETFSWTVDLAGRIASPQLWNVTVLTK